MWSLFQEILNSKITGWKLSQDGEGGGEGKWVVFYLPNILNIKKINKIRNDGQKFVMCRKKMLRLAFTKKEF